MPCVGVYLLNPFRIHSIPSSLRGSGISKSGSPMLRLIGSFIWRARSKIRLTPDGLIFLNRSETNILSLSLFFTLLCLFDELENRVESCLGWRCQGSLDLIHRIMFGQEFRYLHSKLPADHHSSTGKVFIHGSTIFKWDFAA